MASSARTASNSGGSRREGCLLDVCPELHQFLEHGDTALDFGSAWAPCSAYVGGIDFNGDGTRDDLLPGSTVNAFNRGMGRADLEQLVAKFNQTYAGTNDVRHNNIPTLTLRDPYS